MAKSILSYISGTQYFPDMGFMQENRKSTFHFDQIQKKIFLVKLKIYTLFPKHLALSPTISQRHCQVSEKTNDPIQWKCSDRWTEGTSVGITFTTHTPLSYTCKVVQGLPKGPQWSASLVQSVSVFQILSLLKKSKNVALSLKHIQKSSKNTLFF